MHKSNMLTLFRYVALAVCGRLGWLSLAGLLAFAAPVAPVSAQSASGVCPANPAHYMFKSAGKNRFAVEFRTDGKIEQLDIASRSDATGSVKTDDFIGNVRQILADGTEQPLDYIGDGSWHIKAMNSPGTTIVRYDIRAGHDQHPWRIGKEEIAYNFDGASFFTGWTVLLANYANADCPVLVEFDIPDGWTIEAPWQQIDDTTFKIKNIRHLHKNGFALGPSLQSFSTEAGTSKLTIVYENAVAHIASKAKNDIDGLFRYYQNIYGGSAKSNYHIFMVSDAGSDGGAFESSFAMRFSLPNLPADERVWRHGFAHEIGHLWNGIALRAKQPAEVEWFKEGFTDYLTIKATYALGMIDRRQLENKIATMIGRYYLAVFTNGPKSLVEAGTKKQDNRMLVYGGGAVLALLLDAELDRTAGKGSFERMLRKFYARGDRPYALDQLMQVLNEESNGHASVLLSDLGSGLFPAVMKSRLAAYGIGLGFFAPEELYISFSNTDCPDSDTETCPPRFLGKAAMN